MNPTKYFLDKFKYQIAIIFIGLLWLQIMNFLLQLDNQSYIFYDSDNYKESAEMLFLHLKLHYYRPLLMAFISGIPYLFTNSTDAIYQWSFFVNVFCWLGTSILVFEIMKNFLKLKWAFIAAIIPFFMVGSAALNYHLLTENIYTFAIILSFYFLLKYFKTNTFLYLSISLSIMLLSMLIKPGSKFLALVMCLFFIRQIFKNYKTKACFLIYGSLLLISVQVIGMKAQYGDYTISYIDGITYYNYICSKAVCIEENKIYDSTKNPRADYIFGINDHSARKEIALLDLKQQLQFNTINVIKAYFSNVFNNLKSVNGCIRVCVNSEKTNYFEKSKEIFLVISKYQNRIFSILGFVLASLYLINYRKHNKIFLFFSFFILYTLVLSGISSNQGDRFHFVTFPFVIMLLIKYISDKNLLIKNH